MLTTGPEQFGSRTTIRFTASAPRTFVELKPARLVSVRLNGTALDPRASRRNRLPLHGLGESNELVVEAEMAYSNSGEGLHRFGDPADGRALGANFRSVLPQPPARPRDRRTEHVLSLESPAGCR